MKLNSRVIRSVTTCRRQSKIVEGATRTLALTLLGICACGSVDSPGRITVRDSAGIEIVKLGQLTDRVAYVLPAPAVVLGVNERDPLENPTQGVILSHGIVAIADVSRREVLFFDSAGKSAGHFGGPGQGPNEVRNLRAAVRAPRNAVMVQDAGNRRVTALRPGAEPASYQLSDPATLSQHIVIGAQSEHSVLLRPAGFDPYFEEPWLQVPIARVDLETEVVDTLGFFDWVPGIEGDTRNVFAPTGSIAVGSTEVLIVRGDKPEVRQLDRTGRAIRIIRWDARPSPYSEEQWETFETYYRDVVRERDPSRVEQELANARSAASGPLPYIGRVVASQDGEIWIGQFSADPRFDKSFSVFAGNGNWLGRVDLPPRFRVLDVGFGYLLGLRLDELDVPAVGMYKLTPSEEQP